MLIDEITDPIQLAISLTGMMDARPRGYRPKPRSLRISDLPKYKCMRALRLEQEHGIKKIYRNSPNTDLVFDTGTILHFMVRNYKKYFAETVRGWWLCLACGHIHTPLMARPGKCVGCGARSAALVYYEAELSYSRLYGHPDMFLEMPDKRCRLGEIKSIDKDKFNLLGDNPPDDNVFQLRGYMTLTRWMLRGGMSLGMEIDTTVGYLAYVPKGSVPGFPLRVYRVAFDYHVESDIRRKVLAFSGKSLPEPLASCVSWDFGTNCRVRKECANAYNSEKR